MIDLKSLLPQSALMRSAARLALTALALSASACRPEAVGSALSLQNALGFTITVISIHLTAAWQTSLQFHLGWLWLIGPVLGVLAMRKLVASLET